VNSLRPRLSYANVTASLALFIAVSGAGAYAAGLAPKSVGAPELRPGAVTANKLRKNAVITPKVKAQAITTPKLADSAVDGRVLAPGSVSGEKIVFGAITHDKVGPEAITGDQIVESSLTQVPIAGFADSATNAESANPLAFADVDETGALNSNLSKGLSPADVRLTATGVYCISVPGFNPRGAVVTPKTINTDGVIATATIGGTGTCPAPRVEVQTYRSDGSRLSARFYVVLYR
jgi:hypothetical protein